MEQSSRTLMRGGADGEALADFAQLADATAADGSPRYAERRHLQWLARLVAGEATGPNRDAPLFELCHLVTMIDAVWAGSEGRWMAFFGLERPSGRAFRTWFREGVGAAGWRRTGFELVEDGIERQAGGETFRVTFARMPTLAALFEFLMGMEGAAHHAEVEALFSTLCAAELTTDSVQKASNALAKYLRRYRKDHFVRAEHEERFTHLFKFLRERGGGTRLGVDDQAVLAFWQADTGGDFRGFATVADAFVALNRVLRLTARGEAAGSAVPLGQDRDQGEWDIATEDVDAVAAEAWISPFDLLDQPPAQSVKFFKKESERKPLETLAKFGPDADALPMTVLRLEAFGPIQSAISNDLRLSRDTLAGRLDCDGARSYAEIHDKMAELTDHLAALQKAALWALHRGRQMQVGETGNVVALVPPGVGQADHLFAEAQSGGGEIAEVDQAALLAEAEASFKRLTRKGFDESLLKEAEHLEGFRVGTGAVLTLNKVLNRYLDRLKAKRDCLDDLFAEDRRLFADQFRRLYGEEV